MVQVRKVLVLLYRRKLSILFPLLSGSLIYADWSHTQAWKAAKANKLALN